MSRYSGTCEFCGKDVFEHDSAAYRVRGWEIQRKAGGANYIAGKERQPNRIAHARCVEHHLLMDKSGLRGQMTL